MRPDFFKFTIVHQSKKSKARVGLIETPHGVVNTPGFVAVGTNGTLKALDNVLVDALGQELMFCNTYHLLLHPGPDVVAKAGGLHQFIHRKQPIITDSGGFQVFSLAYGGVTSELKRAGKKTLEGGAVLKISEEGVLFRSYRDGAKLLLTPELSVQAQKKLGADIIIPFDELPPYHIQEKALEDSLERTHRWELRSLEEHLKNRQQQAMYAVVHGGVDATLRQKSANYLSQLPFDGFAIGGSLGKSTQDVIAVLQYTIPHLPPEKPNHLLGIGDLATVDPAILAGIDTCDSSYPTKVARHGLLIHQNGETLKIMRQAYREDFQPPDPSCACHTCRHYSRAYLHHLFKAHEPIAGTLASIHNIVSMNTYFSKIRAAILAGHI